MSSSLQHTISSSSSNLDEVQWVNNIRRSLEKDEEDDVEVPVSVFNVPKILMSSYPDCYAPQQLSLGPYHYWRLELHEMERYKLFAAKMSQKQLQSQNFEILVEHLMKLESKIRASYHKYLNFDGETIAWIMALDAAFLLELLQIYASHQEPKILNKVSSRMSLLLDYSKRKVSAHHNAILRDIVMLENQIPLFILRKVVELQSLSLESADDMLLSMLMGFCKEISPFRRMKAFPKIKISENAHLLDFLYHTMVPKVEESIEILEEAEDGIGTEAEQEKEESSAYLSYVKQLLDQIWNLVSSINIRKLSFLKKILQAGGILLKLPCTILSNFPGLAAIKRSSASIEPENGTDSSIHDPPLIEEITIPSVTELHKTGVRFVPTNCNVSIINFDVKTLTFYLPTICLDMNTEVILRNLVAYEASSESGAMVFTRYTELMNGIIDTEEDVKLLRENGIIVNRLKSDEEAADMWNGMTRSIRLTRVPFLDKVIEDVNKHYDCQWKVKVGKFMKQHVFGSWKLLTFLATILLLLLTALQSFCSVYNCVGLFHIQNSS